MAKEFVEALKKLRADPESLSLAKRRELSGTLAKDFENGKGDENGAALAVLLASDSRWEVRKTIANVLSHLPDEIEVRLLAQLSADDNAFVRKAVDRAIEHRRRTRKSRARQQRGLEQVRQAFVDLEKTHGPAAAKKARRIVDRMYEMMARTASHELLGRMTPLKSDTNQLLAKSRSKQMDPVEFARTLKNVADRLDFVERFLHALKSYATAIPENRTRENLADVVDEAHRAALEKLIATDSDVKRVSFQAAIPSTLQVEMARLQVVVALSDLIKNAYESFKDYAPSNTPSVKVDARRIADDRVQIKISDNGCGLTSVDLADVREFVPGKSSKKVQGTGFGVPNARRIAQEHEGEFEFQSIAEQGTSITITLPLRKKDSADEA